LRFEDFEWRNWNARSPCFYISFGALLYIPRVGVRTAFRSAMKFQKLYLVGIYNQDLNVGKVAEAFLLASWDALILFFLTMLTFQVRAIPNQDYNE